jgi:hypothetical protein
MKSSITSNTKRHSTYQHGSAVGSNLLVGLQLVNRETMLGQRRSHFVNDTRVVGTLETEIARVCVFGNIE